MSEDISEEKIRNGKAKWYEITIRKILSNEKYKGDALLQKTYTVDFLSKKRMENEGQVPQYYVEDSHPAIINKDIWEAVQLELERRKEYAAKHGIQKLEYATVNNPFAGRVICGHCGTIFGRKVWNSTDDRLRMVIWRCNSKYAVKGEKGCENRHIDDRVLYEAFVNVFNTIVKNRNYFMEKWRVVLENCEDKLKAVTAQRFIKIFSKSEPTNQFDVDLYFKLVEKTTVYNEGKLIVSLLDGSEIC